VVEFGNIQVPILECTSDGQQQLTNVVVDVIKDTSGNPQLALFLTLFQQIYAIRQAFCNNKTSFTQELGVDLQASTLNLPSNSAFVLVEVTQRAGNARVQKSGVVGVPDVWFQGWVWFGNSSNALFERQPLDADRKVYPVPPGATKVNVTVYSGGLCKVTAVVNNVN
jgi:hypothetical protein